MQMRIQHDDAWKILRDAPPPKIFAVEFHIAHREHRPILSGRKRKFKNVALPQPRFPWKRTVIENAYSASGEYGCVKSEAALFQRRYVSGMENPLRSAVTRSRFSEDVLKRVLGSPNFLLRCRCIAFRIMRMGMRVQFHFFFSEHADGGQILRE